MVVVLAAETKRMAPNSTDSLLLLLLLQPVMPENRLRTHAQLATAAFVLASTSSILFGWLSFFQQPQYGNGSDGGKRIQSFSSGGGGDDGGRLYSELRREHQVCR